MRGLEVLRYNEIKMFLCLLLVFQDVGLMQLSHFRTIRGDGDLLVL